MPVWVNSPRIGRRISELLGTQTERLAFIASRVVSIVIPLEEFYEPMTIEIPATAGNATFTISPRGKGHKIKLLYGRVALTTDGSGGNRYINFKITDESGNILTYNMNSQVAALSTTIAHSFDVMETNQVNCQASDTSHTNLSESAVIFDDDKFVISIVNGVAGDSYSGRFKVLVY